MSVRTDEGGSQTVSREIMPGNCSVHKESGGDSNAPTLQVLGVEVRDWGGGGRGCAGEGQWHTFLGRLERIARRARVDIAWRQVLTQEIGSQFKCRHVTGVGVSVVAWGDGVVCV